MSTYAVLWLGRSMGIVVSVRAVVLAGPYRWVRHPIYLGYLFVLAGMFLTTYTPRMAMGVAGAVALLVWRARLEEGLLCAHSPAYREWMRHTGFLWPRRKCKMQNAKGKMPESGTPSAGLGSSSAC